MFQCLIKSQSKGVSKIISVVIAVSFLFTSIAPSYAQAVSMPSATNGMILAPTPAFNPVLLRAIEIDPMDPFHFGFIVDSGDTQMQGEALTEEAKKLIRYFLASLTTPEQDMWVNLSPYEADRIIPESFGQTQMGRDLLAQDYILKQLTASLIYPEDELGQQFWQKVYKRAYEQYGTTDIPIDTFNKVWIMPKKASVYEHNNRVFVIDSELDVMMEEDFLAVQKSREEKVESRENKGEAATSRATTGSSSPFLTSNVQPLTSDISSSIIRTIIIPEIKREVNFGEHFANLRQIYHAMILAAWYKNNLKESLLGQMYVDQNKIMGIDLVEASEKERIYNEYLETFKQGVYNFIKVEHDQYSGKHIPRKYFSGGMDATNLQTGVDYATTAKAIKKLSEPSGPLTHFGGHARPTQKDSDSAMVSSVLTKTDFFKIVEYVKVLASQDGWNVLSIEPFYREGSKDDTLWGELFSNYDDFLTSDLMEIMPDQEDFLSDVSGVYMTFENSAGLQEQARVYFHKNFNGKDTVRVSPHNTVSKNLAIQSLRSFSSPTELPFILGLVERHFELTSAPALVSEDSDKAMTQGTGEVLVSKDYVITAPSQEAAMIIAKRIEDGDILSLPEPDEAVSQRNTFSLIAESIFLEGSEEASIALTQIFYKDLKMGLPIVVKETKGNKVIITLSVEENFQELILDIFKGRLGIREDDIVSISALTAEQVNNVVSSFLKEDLKVPFDFSVSTRKDGEDFIAMVSQTSHKEDSLLVHHIAPELRFLGKKFPGEVKISLLLDWKRHELEIKISSSDFKDNAMTAQAAGAAAFNTKELRFFLLPTNPSKIVDPSRAFGAKIIGIYSPVFHQTIFVEIENWENPDRSSIKNAYIVPGKKLDDEVKNIRMNNLSETPGAIGIQPGDLRDDLLHALKAKHGPESSLQPIESTLEFLSEVFGQRNVDMFLDGAGRRYFIQPWKIKEILEIIDPEGITSRRVVENIDKKLTFEEYTIRNFRHFIDDVWVYHDDVGAKTPVDPDTLQFVVKDKEAYTTYVFKAEGFLQMITALGARDRILKNNLLRSMRSVIASDQLDSTAQTDNAMISSEMSYSGKIQFPIMRFVDLFLKASGRNLAKDVHHPVSVGLNLISTNDQETKLEDGQALTIRLEGRPEGQDSFDRVVIKLDSGTLSILTSDLSLADHVQSTVQDVITVASTSDKALNLEDVVAFLKSQGIDDQGIFGKFFDRPMPYKDWPKDGLPTMIFGNQQGEGFVFKIGPLGEGYVVESDHDFDEPATVHGGIIMSSQGLDMQIRRDDNGIPLPLLDQPVEFINVPGFTFEIMTITPITNLLLLSGLADDQDAIGATSVDAEDLQAKMPEFLDFGLPQKRFI